MVPDYLHNRPPKFVKHCLKSKFAAQEIQENDITCLNHKEGKFHVKSSRNKKVSYLVQFIVPSCMCESWRQSTFLCKHFFAIFNFFPKWQFSNLPESYRESVFITLDTDDLLINPAENDNSKSDGSNMQTEDLTQLTVDSPSPCSPVKQESKTETPKITVAHEEPVNVVKLQKKFQDALAGLKDVSFLLDDVGVLQEATTIVEKLLSNLRATCPKAEGLFLRSSPEKKKLKITTTEYHKVFHKKLSLRRKKKKTTTTKETYNLTANKVRKTNR